MGITKQMLLAEMDRTCPECGEDLAAKEIESGRGCCSDCNDDDDFLDDLHDDEGCDDETVDEHEDEQCAGLTGGGGGADYSAPELCCSGAVML